MGFPSFPSPITISVFSETPREKLDRERMSEEVVNGFVVTCKYNGLVAGNLPLSNTLFQLYFVKSSGRHC